jgi:hypothetical protein
MSRIWSTAALALLLAGLVGYIYFVDADRPLTSIEERDALFTDLEADAIDELQIRGTAGEAARLRKTDGTWRLVEPAEAAADEGEVSSVTSGLAAIEIDRIVDAEAADLAQYGLDPARIEVAFKTAGQDDFRRIRLGDKTPTGGNIYASVEGQGRVFLLPSYLDSTFNKDAFTLRDRRILTFDRDAVDRLQVNDGRTTIELAKSGSEWRLVSPVSARAEYAAVEGALERLSSTRMQSLVDAEGAEQQASGLNRPTGTITVGAGSARATLTLGATDNALLFAKDSSRPIVFTVAPTIRGDVIRSVADFRRKDLFDGRGFTATRVEIQRGDQTLVLEKSVDSEGATIWKTAGGEEVDAEKATDLLTKVTALRAASFETTRHPSLANPVLVVTLSFDADKRETVTFGRTGDGVVASRADDPGTATVEGLGLDDVLTALDEVQ